MRCLLVEDERQVREGMASLVPWAELGFDTVLTAGNGLEALELLEERGADLVISDVRMARMNGVQLLETLRERGMDTPFLFISGFSDKEYLMAAIRYHVVDYLEKPVMIPELTERVRAIVASRKEAPAPVTAGGLIAGTGPIPPHCAGAEYWIVGLLTLAENGFRLTRQQIESTVLSFHRAVVMEEESPDRMCILFAGQGGPLPLQTLVDAFNRAGGGYALCASDPVSDTSLLAAAYAQASDCASRAFLGPLRGLQTPADVSMALNAVSGVAVRRIARLKAEGFYPCIPDTVAAAASALPAGAYRADAVSLLTALARAAGSQVAEEGFSSVGTWRDALALLLEETRRAADALLEERTGPAVARAVRYIAANLAGELSVPEIASAAYISPSYLNYLFSHQAGHSVRQYITQLRVEKAKLLLQAGKSVQETAAEVGVRDSMYFSKVFRRYTGLSPSEYR